MTLLGDLNINYLDHKTVNTRKLIALEKEFGLLQTIKLPTRAGRNSASLLDPIFMNVKFVLAADILNINLSDYLPTYMIYKKTREPSKPVNLTCRPYSKLDTVNFKQELLSFNWTFVYASGDPNYIWGRMYD